jgi:hypothetical protein
MSSPDILFKGIPRGPTRGYTAPEWGAPWRSVFADKPGNSKVAAINWIVANRDATAHVISRTKFGVGQGKYALFTGEVKAGSDFRASRIEKHVGDYYRDLFIHKLPGSLTEIYTGIFLDGCLVSVVGLHLKNMRTGAGLRKTGSKRDPEPAHITFAFTVPHDKYTRLHKLTLMSIVSKWFWDDVLGKEGWYELNGAPRKVQTTMLTEHPENKTARGVLKMIYREPQKDGTYKLGYQGDILARDRQETLTEWLTKFGTLTK